MNAAAVGASGSCGDARDHRAAARSLDWAEARRVAARAGRPLEPETVPLPDAVGRALAAPLTARADLPAFDTSAMDGWAVAGPGPWRLTGGLLAGQHPEPLADGDAVGIATGAQLPPGATAVLRREYGEARAGRLHDRGPEPLEPGRDIRPRGQECRTGDVLLAPGTPVTPAVLGLAAAAGHDELTVRRRPRVDLLVLGDELLDAGPPRDGRIRDALGPLLPPWLRALGAGVTGARRVRDDFGLLRDALRLSTADVVVTTGGTAAGPVDFLHAALEQAGATLLVDGVRVRPGHPMLLAELRPAGTGAARYLVGLPGNPLAAVSGVLTLAAPLLGALAGRAPAGSRTASAAVPFAGHPAGTRLVPVRLTPHGAEPLPYDGPAMLRGLATADALGVVPPPGVPAGAEVELLALPPT